MKPLVARGAPFFAVLVLIANDHVLKYAYPGVITGKLSDIAGLFFFPLLVVDALGLCRPEIRRQTSWLLCACLATGVAFAAVKLWAPANAVYATGLAMLQWPFRALGGLLHHGGAPRLRPVRLVMDATDLVALPVLIYAYRYGMRAAAKSPLAPHLLLLGPKPKRRAAPVVESRSVI